MRALLGGVLGLPLAAMLCGLLAVVIPVDWHDWLVLMMLLCLVFWAALIVMRPSWPSAGAGTPGMVPGAIPSAAWPKRPRRFAISCFRSLC